MLLTCYCIYTYILILTRSLLAVNSTPSNKNDPKKSWMKIVSAHSKKQKGLPALSRLNCGGGSANNKKPYDSFNANAGNVELNQSIFNSMNNVSGNISVDASSGNVSMAESYDFNDFQWNYNNLLFKEILIRDYWGQPLKVKVTGIGSGEETEGTIEVHCDTQPTGYPNNIVPVNRILDIINEDTYSKYDKESHPSASELDDSFDMSMRTLL